MPHLSRVDRVRGCLLGLAVGDALGAPLEGLSSQQIKSHYGRVKNYVDGVQAWKRKPYRWRLRGLYSDDTQQALALCDVLLDHRAGGPGAAGRSLPGLATPKGSFVGAHRGIGRSFRQVLAALERGVPAHLAGQTDRRDRRGHADCPGPPLLRRGPRALFDSVMAASLMTHRDIRSLSGALAVVPRDPRLSPASRATPACCSGSPPTSSRTRNASPPDYGDARDQARRARAQPVAGHRPRRVGARPPRDRALAALVDEANRHGAEPVCKRPDPGFPAGVHPDLPVSPADDRQLRGSRDRGRQPRRRCRHRRRDPRRHGRGLLRRRRDPQALARRSPEPRGHRGPGPGPGPAAPATACKSPT